MPVPSGDRAAALPGRECCAQEALPCGARGAHGGTRAARATAAPRGTREPGRVPRARARRPPHAPRHPRGVLLRAAPAWRGPPAPPAPPPALLLHLIVEPRGAGQRARHRGRCPRRTPGRARVPRRVHQLPRAAATRRDALWSAAPNGVQAPARLQDALHLHRRGHRSRPPRGPAPRRFPQQRRASPERGACALQDWHRCVGCASSCSRESRLGRSLGTTC